MRQHISPVVDPVVYWLKSRQTVDFLNPQERRQVKEIGKIMRIGGVLWTTEGHPRHAPKATKNGHYNPPCRNETNRGKER